MWEFQGGDAVISKKHCNFFVNNGKAKSSDIEKLINKVKTVNDKAGVDLELEIKIVSDKKLFIKSGWLRKFRRRAISIDSGKACIKALKKKYLVSTFDPKFKNYNLINKKR